MFENLKARLDRLLQDHARPDPRARAAALREALLEAKVGVSTMRSALAATEKELAAERQHLADAERRGRLAGEAIHAFNARGLAALQPSCRTSRPWRLRFGLHSVIGIV